jgi:hypothetical protein
MSCLISMGVGRPQTVLMSVARHMLILYTKNLGLVANSTIVLSL